MKINNINIDPTLALYGVNTHVSASDIMDSNTETSHVIMLQKTDSNKAIFIQDDVVDFTNFKRIRNYDYVENKKLHLDTMSANEFLALQDYYVHKTQDGRLLYFEKFMHSYMKIRNKK